MCHALLLTLTLSKALPSLSAATQIVYDCHNLPAIIDFLVPQISRLMLGPNHVNKATADK
jgi:hypothetical protein